MTPIQIVEKVKDLEARIEEIKWGITQLNHQQATRSRVKAAFGILGKKFPSGIIYESRIRRSWRKHSSYSHN